MSAGQLRMPSVFAWALFFAPGVVFVVVDIVRLNITGLFLLGVLLLGLWLWLIGGFERSFWIADRASTPAGGQRHPQTRDAPQRRSAPGGA